jgi:hypothetical protein
LFTAPASALRRARWVASVGLCLSFALGLLWPGTASAAGPVPGERFLSTPGTVIDLSCGDPALCGTSTPDTISGVASFPDSLLRKEVQLVWYSQDPRVQPFYPTAAPSAYGANAPGYLGLRVIGVATSVTNRPVGPFTLPANARYLVAWEAGPCGYTSECVALAGWDLRWTPPPPDPEPEPEPEPDPEPPAGSLCGLTEASPCYVHQVNAQPVEVGDVSALTPEQWAELQLALGTLCFFVVAGFVASWRSGRGS